MAWLVGQRPTKRKPGPSRGRWVWGRSRWMGTRLGFSHESLPGSIHYPWDPKQIGNGSLSWSQPASSLATQAWPHGPADGVARVAGLEAMCGSSSVALTHRGCSTASVQPRAGLSSGMSPALQWSPGAGRARWTLRHRRHSPTASTVQFCSLPSLTGSFPRVLPN